MGGRYGRLGDKQRIAETFDLGELDGLYLETSPSHNIAPATMQPVIVADRDTHERQLRIICWGLIPPWTKSLKDFKLTIIKAKAEDVASKPLWRKPFEHLRYRPSEVYEGRAEFEVLQGGKQRRSGGDTIL